MSGALKSKRYEVRQRLQDGLFEAGRLAGGSWDDLLVFEGEVGLNLVLLQALCPKPSASK